jgi:hypothetical protein
MMLQLWCIRIDYHAVSWHLRTRSKDLPSIIFYHTHTAGAISRKFRMITECRQINSRFSDNRKHIFFIIKCNFSIINCHIFHCFPLLCFYMNCVECTGTLTGTTFNTDTVINNIRLFNLSADCTNRTVSCTF